MKKPVVILSLCVALLLFGVGVVAESAERETYISGGYTYALLEDGDAEILLYGAYEVDPVFREVEDLLIPSVLDGHPVTRIADRAFYPCRRRNLRRHHFFKSFSSRPCRRSSGTVP